MPKTIKASAFNFTFEITCDGKNYIYFYPQVYYDKNGELQLLDKQNIVNRIALDAEEPAQNATIEFLPNESETFKITSEKIGKCIDKKNLLKQIDIALLTGKNKVCIESEQVKPLVTKEDLKKQTCLRSKFSTFYGYSTAERKHNIALCIKFLNGIIIYPGEIFSFNQTVGKRSEERGFLPAKVILNGSFVEGVGGGVCQVSSTLYNAFLLAGLTPIESHNHSLCVSYVKPSFDAMVSDGLSDLRFQNPYDFPIYLECRATGEDIIATIYGEKRKYEYKLISKVIESIPAKTTQVFTEDITLKNVDAKNGLKSEGYLYIYDGDNLVEIKKLRSDTYKPINGIEYINSDRQKNN
ncbi:MAG: VanW family protein [Clostridia bacterium]|nr:VanW family protein [Clostridia bacterium]